MLLGSSIDTQQAQVEQGEHRGSLASFSFYPLDRQLVRGTRICSGLSQLRCPSYRQRYRRVETILRGRSWPAASPACRGARKP
jgi:hypothetical protein